MIILFTYKNMDLVLLKDAMNSDESEHWLDVMKNKIKSMSKNQI